jgi:hypothetical protein
VIYSLILFHLYCFFEIPASDSFINKRKLFLAVLESRKFHIEGLEGSVLGEGSASKTVFLSRTKGTHPSQTLYMASIHP